MSSAQPTIQSLKYANKAVQVRVPLAEADGIQTATHPEYHEISQIMNHINMSSEAQDGGDKYKSF